MVVTMPKLGPAQEKLMRAALRLGELRTATPAYRNIANTLNGKQFLRKDGKDADFFTPTEKAYETFAAWGYRPKAEPVAAAPANDDAPRLIRIADIDVGYRLRGVDPERVEALKASIGEIGLRTPITVMVAEGGRFRLSAGAHRLETMRQLGRTEIWCFVRSGHAFDAELWEIDENLCRADLTPADRAMFVFRRKELYLMKHPETASGENQHTRGRQVGEPSERFTAATAVATGRSERSLQRDAERGEKISEKALRMLRGTHLDKGAMLDRLKQLPEDYQVRYIEETLAEEKRVQARSKEIRSAKLSLKRKVRTGLIKAIAEQGRSAPGEWPIAAYAVGYADPPWEQQAYSDETGQDKGLLYPAMPLDEIKALCAGDRSPFTRDAIVYLWVTANRLADGIDVLRAWGFAYVSCIVWDKVHIGMGRWVRDRHELVLIGKRGDFPGLAEGTQPHSLFSEVKSEHSRKPVKVAEDIDRLFPDLPKLELFQRRQSLAPGDVRLKGNWSFWGNESGVDQ